jgi:heme exporter protein D
MISVLLVYVVDLGVWCMHAMTMQPLLPLVLEVVLQVVDLTKLSRAWRTAAARCSSVRKANKKNSSNAHS